MVIGIDLGTSGVKVALLDAHGKVIAVESAPLEVSRPQPLWSEQDAESWWRATDRAMQALAQQHDLSGVKAIGLSGQMHGATLLDSENRVLRPAILTRRHPTRAASSKRSSPSPTSRCWQLLASIRRLNSPRHCSPTRRTCGRSGRRRKLRRSRHRRWCPTMRRWRRRRPHPR